MCVEYWFSDPTLETKWAEDYQDLQIIDRRSKYD